MVENRESKDVDTKGNLEAGPCGSVHPANSDHEDDFFSIHNLESSSLNVFMPIFEVVCRNSDCAFKVESHCVFEPE